MKECLVVGQTNVGKTAFVLSLAEYAGLEKIDVTFTYPDGFSTRQTYALSIARQELVGHTAHKTRCLQSVKIKLQQGKGSAVVEVVDSSGLMEGVHQDAEIRRAVSQTLQRIRTAHVVLHIIDAALLGRQEQGRGHLSEVEQQVMSFCGGRSHYAIIANKMDLSTAMMGLSRLRSSYPEALILPVSALNGTGFREVKAFVGRHI